MSPLTKYAGDFMEWIFLDFVTFIKCHCGNEFVDKLAIKEVIFKITLSEKLFLLEFYDPKLQM